MIALIMGAAGGLGRVLAAECARRGYSLFLTDVDSHGLEAVRQGLARQFGVEVRVHACNLADAADLEAMLAVIDAAKMRFDMLFNVAGMDLEGGFMRLSREEAVEILQANVSSALRITHALLKRSSRPFYLVFVSSLAAMFPMPLKATYAASKRFLLDFPSPCAASCATRASACSPCVPAACLPTPRPSAPCSRRGSGGASRPARWKR